MASSLNEESVEKKLMTVTNTQDSIQSLSLWIIHHKSHHERIVELWSKVLRKSVKPSHRLTLFYLCNDVVQNSKRKKAPVFIETFKQHLKQATALVRQAGDEVMPQSKKQRKEKRDMSIKAKVERIFSIWEERQVYDKEFIKEIKAILDGKRADISDHPNKTGHHHSKPQKKPVDPAFSPASVDDMEAIQPADPTLTDLQAEKSKEKEKNTPSPEVLAEFKPQEMVEKIRVYKRLESDIEVKIRQLSHLKLDASSIEAIKQLKDRAHGNEFSTQFEESCLRLEELVKGVEKKQQDQASLLEVLVISEYFYDEQNREARIVANAYKNFGARINSMKRRLDELKKTLPSAPSPIPSPSLDAPSPGNTPPYLDTNTHPVDMDLDTGEEPRLEDDDIPSPPDEAPSPVSSPDDLGVDGKGGSLDNRLASIIPTLKSSSIMKEQPIPVYIPQPLAISSSTPRRPSANKTLTEAELPFPVEEGGGTPLTDETPTTPVMDEQPSVGSSPPPPPDKKKQKENPIDFLSRLISQTQKSKPTGSSSSFLETFSLLTSKSSEPVGLGSRDGEGSMSPPMSQGPKSWAAWKAQTEKGVDDMAGPASLASSAGLPPPPLPTFVLAPPPPPSSMSVPPPGPVLPPTMVPPVPPPMASPTFYQHTSPGQKENWPEVQSGTNGAVDVVPPNIVYPPLQEVSPPTFPSLSKVPVKGILRKTSHSVLKELTPSSEEITSSVSQLPPPPPPPNFGALSSADIRPPDQPPLGASAVGSLSMGSGLKDEAEEFMEKLKRKTAVSSVVASYTPNPIRPNLMTLTPGSDGDDGMGEMDMDLDEEDESASEGEVGRPKGIPVLSSVVRRVEHPEKPSREKERLRDGRELSSHEHSSSSSRDPRDAFHKDRHYSRRTSDPYSPGQNYDYRDSRSFGYGPPPAPSFFDPYSGNPPYFSGGDPFDAYNYGPPPPKRPYASPSHQRRSNYHHY